MGEVYTAQDRHLSEAVAIKTIRGCFTSDGQLVHRFRDEVQHSEKVTHPNVCRIYDLFTADTPNRAAVFRSSPWSL